MPQHKASITNIPKVSCSPAKYLSQTPTHKSLSFHDGSPNIQTSEKNVMRK